MASVSSCCPPAAMLVTALLAFSSLAPVTASPVLNANEAAAAEAAAPSTQWLSRTRQQIIDDLRRFNLRASRMTTSWKASTPPASPTAPSSKAQSPFVIAVDPKHTPASASINQLARQQLRDCVYIRTGCVKLDPEKTSWYMSSFDQFLK